MGNKLALPATTLDVLTKRGQATTDALETTDLTSRQLHVKLVKETWDKVSEDLMPFGYSFYANVFTTYPTWRLTLFVGVDMREQPQLLMEMMNIAVETFLADGGQLTSHEAIVVLEALGERHAGYGVDEADYSMLGRCFLDTLQARFQPSGCFNSEHRQAFTRLYGCVVQHMMRGHNSARGTFLAHRWAERLVEVDSTRLSNGWRIITTHVGIRRSDLAAVLRGVMQSKHDFNDADASTQRRLEREFEIFAEAVERLHTEQGAAMEEVVMRILSGPDFSKALTGDPSGSPEGMVVPKNDGRRVELYCEAIHAFLASCLPHDLALIDTWQRKFTWMSSCVSSAATI